MTSSAIVIAITVHDGTFHQPAGVFGPSLAEVDNNNIQFRWLRLASFLFPGMGCWRGGRRGYLGSRSAEGTRTLVSRSETRLAIACGNGVLLILVGYLGCERTLGVRGPARCTLSVQLGLGAEVGAYEPGSAVPRYFS